MRSAVVKSGLRNAMFIVCILDRSKAISRSTIAPSGTLPAVGTPWLIEAAAPANGRAPGQGGVQFAPGGGAATSVVPRTNIQVDEQNNKRLAVLPPGITIQELVNSLNALGIGPRDMISILQAIKAAGAMQADLEVR